jgi:hypothetical protein
MTPPAYPAARDAAARIHPHYAHQTQPDVETIEAIIDVAFWTSLRREEIYTPRVSLAFVSPPGTGPSVVFERPVPLASQPLTRLGPAVERPGIHLCVWRQDGTGDLLVWGATRNLPRLCFVLEVLAPGLLVIKRSRGDDSGKFVNVAVLQGDEIKIIDPRAATAPDSPQLLASLFGPANTVNVAIELAVSMREHGRGGSLLVVPEANQTWRESILQPVAYAVSPPFSGLRDLMTEDPAEKTHRRWQEALRRAVDGIAGLTAVDGATIVNERYNLLAFGAKIVRRAGCQQVSEVVVTEPIEGAVSQVAEPGQLGGTRHLSAAQFAHDQHDAIALVASQDGRFTVFGWSNAEQRVSAHRIEALLL